MKWRIEVGDCRDVLRQMPAGSVHTVVTSPPYFGLRDYGTGEWEGGDPACDHARAVTHTEPPILVRRSCPCGAIQRDRQIGLEPTPDEFVAALVGVFREVWRVLRDDGTAWLNLGDSYAATSTYNGSRSMHDEAGWKQAGRGPNAGIPFGLKPKDLLMIPARVAMALQQPWYSGTIKDERDRIWLAAMIDAEGCMFIHKRKVGQSNGQGYVRKNDTYGAGLEVSSTDRVIVERIMEITGRGSICEQDPDQNARRKQTLYRWNLRSNECREVIREVYPHLVAKQHEARLVIGCPSSGTDAERAHESLKAIHQGGTPDIDFAPPASMFERGWCLRSDVIWAKLAEPDAGERDGPADEEPRVRVPVVEGAAVLL